MIVCYACPDCKEFIMFTAFRVKNVFAFSIVFMLAFPVNAADIVLSDVCSLADAIKAANTDEATGGCPAGDGADTITLTADITLDAALPHITSEITLEGDDRTISGNNRFRIFAVNGGTLTVNDLTMTKGMADWGGAIVNVNGGTLTINQSTISHSKAPEGGAIGGNGLVSISNSVLIRNSADVGGAVHSVGGTVEIKGSRIAQNSSENGGAGGIYVSEGTMNIANVTFNDNEATGAGGAIYIHDGVKTLVSGCIFHRNVSRSGGGAIGVSGGEHRIADSVFEYNVANTSGGGISAQFSGLEITDSRISHNVAERVGGGISTHFGTVAIRNALISNNESRTGGRASAGGGIHNGAKLSIVNSTIGNNAADQGAGIVSDRDIEISNSFVTGNSALHGGGGLYVEDDTAILSNVTLVSNSAKKGGGLYRKVGAIIHLQNTIIAHSKGGDCYGRLSENVANLIADGSCFATLSGDPMLGELVETEDGSPAYLPLLEGSPAIDAAHDDYCPDTDIVGTPRPQGTACDIGAFEYTGPASD